MAKAGCPAASGLLRPVRLGAMASLPRLFVLLCLLVGALDVARAAPQAPPGRGWTWVVTPAPDLTSLHVRVCFRAFRPWLLTLPLAAGRGALRPRAAQEGTASLVAVEGGWSLSDPIDRGAPCVEYDVDVPALVAAGSAERISEDLLTQPGAWLLVPARFTAAEDARVELALPPGMSASVPWPLLASGEHAVGPTAFAFASHVAFGRFAPRRLEIAGAGFEVAVLDAPHQATPSGIDRWIRAAGEAVAELYGGRFPVPQVQVLVEPVRPSSEPVVFGRALLSGGAAILLYLSASAREADLPLEWVAVHELIHLGLPAIHGEDAWLNEGFVTYYQEVLRARAGHFGAAGPWQALDEGFARGRRKASDRSIAADSRTMHAQHGYHRVYWAGAALALRVDLALRAETAGRRSLDDVLRLWATPDFTSRGGWRALDLLAEADRALGTRSCVASVRGPLASSDFPATDDLYAALGLSRDGERLVLSTVPGQAALRAAVGGRR